MKAQKIVTITSRVEKKDKNDVPFVTMEVSTPDTVYTRNSQGIMAPLKQLPQSLGGLNAWSVSNLPSLKEKGKPDPEFNFQLGDEVLGDIVTRNVTTLDGKRVFIADSTTNPPKTAGPDKQTIDGKVVTGRYVDSMRVVVFGDTTDEADFDIRIAKAFKRKGYMIVEKTMAQLEAIKATPLEPETKEDVSAKQAAAAK